MTYTAPATRGQTLFWLHSCPSSLFTVIGGEGNVRWWWGTLSVNWTLVYLWGNRILNQVWPQISSVTQRQICGFRSVLHDVGAVGRGDEDVQVKDDLQVVGEVRRSVDGLQTSGEKTHVETQTQIIIICFYHNNNVHHVLMCKMFQIQNFQNINRKSQVFSISSKSHNVFVSDESWSVWFQRSRKFFWCSISQLMSWQIFSVESIWN